MRCPWLFSLVILAGCPDGGASDESSIPTSFTAGDSAMATTGEPTTSTGTTSTGVVDTSDGPGSDCTFCDAPNQACIDDQCVTTCQGVMPDPCGPAQVCDVISGECREPDAPCTLAGPSTACGEASCGPGSVCDDAGGCIPVAPCADVACLDDGHCWGTLCSCERAVDCTPAADALNGPFSEGMVDLEFADDCTAWMLTIISGPDLVRRLAPDGTLTEWAGVTNLDMGEIAVLKSLTPPAGITQPPGLVSRPTAPPPVTVEGIGEVAITYVCCPTCGCDAAAQEQQGVARLVEDDLVEPLQIVIPAVTSGATGPFGAQWTDAGPQALTWGIDRVLYVGNSMVDGEYDTADLEAQTTANVGTFAARSTAAAPVTRVHLLVALLGGSVVRFNVIDGSITPVADVGQDVTSLAHDSFSGLVYASLRDYTIVSIDPFTGAVQDFDVMPGPGRVAISPDGQLFFAPVKIIEDQPVTAYDLPDSF